MFFEKHKLLFRCIIIFLIALSLVSAVNLDMNKSSNKVLNLDPMGIVMCHSEGYEITPPDEEYGNWIYHSVTNDPQIYFFLTGQKLNRISVKLDRKNADVQSVQLYYTHDDEPNISEKNSIIGISSLMEKPLTSTFPKITIS